MEGTQGNVAIPFLDTLVTLLADNSLSITVYCKPTHTDQYLQWDSHHSLSVKYSVIGTLTHRAKTVCTDPQLVQRELQHFRKVLRRCNYPPWAINRVQNKVLNSKLEDHSNNNLTQVTTTPIAGSSKHKQGKITATIHKQTTTKVQAQQQPQVQDPIPQ